MRTIAPEYQWAVSADGTKILIGAERDGNTVSPERGVYLVDLQKKISKTELLARLRTQLKGETALKATATHTFQPIAADVRQLVARESASRIFGYEQALFDFGSKHISRPGNRKASEFLFNTYTSFGYRPEYQWFEPAQRIRRQNRQRGRHTSRHRRSGTRVRRQQPLRFGRSRARCR